MSSSSSNDKVDTGLGNYKEYEHAADQDIRRQKEQKGRANYNKPNINLDVNQEATREDNTDDNKTTLHHGQLDSQTTVKEASDKNSISSDTEYAFDIIMKPSGSEAQELHRDTTLMDTERFLMNASSMPIASNQQDAQVLLPPAIQALLDSYISGIDSDLNSKVYKVPIAETTPLEVATHGNLFDYKSLIAERIQSAEEQIRIKHDELIQDQQQIDDLKRKIHHLSTTVITTTTSLSRPIFSMEVVESGPDKTMYVYKHIQPTPSAVTAQQQQSQPDLGTFVTHSLPSLPPTKTPDLETDQQESRTEQNVPSTAINSTPFYNLVQKQTNEEDY
ncbi:uncharacterized protein ATC70_011505 [Mucor velutinosus]|uniref:Uncharacterized protein n=1 Tax=Mucor velutinosus TaxID=708070 RepID=A0AAN7I104_9FUNG|nr:hypothetical protein ATC70_011505 [Mucor velutinosus]